MSPTCRGLINSRSTTTRILRVLQGSLERHFARDKTLIGGCPATAYPGNHLPSTHDDFVAFCVPRG